MTQASPTILLATKFPESLRAQIDPGWRVTGPFDAPIQAHLGRQDASEVRVLVTVGTLTTDKNLMDHLSGLALICCYGSGYEGVDVAEAARRGIMVTHSPAANAAAVADLAMALLLAANRNLVVADRFVRDGLWQGHAAARMPVVRGLEGRRIGIYGYGAIGAKIAARAAGFDVEIAYHGRAQHPNVPYAFHASLLALAQWADVLMVAVRANAGNRHAVDAAVLRALGAQGILVNISRGSVVDETALIGLLQSGELGTAGLDVFEHEPAVPEALKAIPHVVLTPHIGGGTLAAFAGMEALVLANIAAFFANGTVVTPVPELAQ